MRHSASLWLLREVSVAHWLWRKVGGDERRGIRFVLAVSATFLLACWAFIIAWSDYSRGEALRQADQDLLRWQTVIGAQSVRILQQHEAVLRLVADWIQTHPDRDLRRERDFSQLLQGLSQAAPGLFELRLLRPQGNLRLQEGGWVREREAFTVPPLPVPARQSSAAQLWISPQTAHRQWPAGGLSLAIPVAGNVAGVRGVALSIDLAEWQSLYALARPLPTGETLLLHRDGSLIVAAPTPPATLAVPIAKPLPDTLQGLGQWVGADGLSRRMAYQALADYPLILVVDVVEKELLAPWRKQSLMALIAALTLSFLTLVLAWSLVRMLDRLAADREELLRLATSDALTGLLNRRVFLLRLEQEFERSRRYGVPLSLLVIDCDHFKQVNDGYGHAVGDLALQTLAILGQEVMRSCDIFARMGGEEFAILLPETSLEQAAAVAERLRLAVAKHPLETFAGNLHFTVSIGVSQLESGDLTVESLLVRADNALYAAKHAGRNRVGGYSASNDPSVDQSLAWPLSQTGETVGGA